VTAQKPSAGRDTQLTARCDGSQTVRHREAGPRGAVHSYRSPASFISATIRRSVSTDGTRPLTRPECFLVDLLGKVSGLEVARPLPQQSAGQFLRLIIAGRDAHGAR
jgi:hypothetical protein